MSEPEIIRALFEELMRAPLQPFPGHRGKPNARVEPGVYVIYGARGKVLYVLNAAWHAWTALAAH